jgi:hypothetical protein
MPVSTRVVLDRQDRRSVEVDGGDDMLYRAGERVVGLRAAPCRQASSPTRSASSRTLGGAEQMVRDYIETLTDRDVSDATVVIEPDLGGLEAEASDVRKQIERAQRENRQAAAASRALASELRAAGLSVSDTAAILGVSRGRFSQLVSGWEKVA